MKKNAQIKLRLIKCNQRSFGFPFVRSSNGTSKMLCKFSAKCSTGEMFLTGTQKGVASQLATRNSIAWMMTWFCIILWLHYERFNQFYSHFVCFRQREERKKHISRQNEREIAFRVVVADCLFPMRAHTLIMFHALSTLKATHGNLANRIINQRL